MQIDSIKNYLLNMNDFDRIVDEIYELTINLEQIYPRYKEWFLKNKLRVASLQREIYFL